jgi:hypothetical protein
MKPVLVTMLAGIMILSPITSGFAEKNSNINRFSMVVSAGAKSCLPKATAQVTIKPGVVDRMTVSVSGCLKTPTLTYS